ncbi:MAG: hypothetical protein ACLQGT_04190 [Terracidiphilus sp.]
MRIRRVLVVVVAAAALMGSLSAYAGNNKNKVIANPNESGNYNFTCVGPTLGLKLDSFSLPFSRSAATSTDGKMGAASGKATTSILTIEFAASKAYATLYSQIIKADHYSSCTLVEKVDASATGGAFTLTWIFSQVTPTALTMIWRDPASASSAGANLPAALVKATFTFTEVRLDDGSGSNSATASDDWTATQ